MGRLGRSSTAEKRTEGWRRSEKLKKTWKKVREGHWQYWH